MKKRYEKPCAEVVMFDLNKSIMTTTIADGGELGGVSAGEGTEDGW